MYVCFFGGFHHSSETFFFCRKTLFVSHVSAMSCQPRIWEHVGNERNTLPPAQILLHSPFPWNHYFDSFWGYQSQKLGLFPPTHHFRYVRGDFDAGRIMRQIFLCVSNVSNVGNTLPNPPPPPPPPPKSLSTHHFPVGPRVLPPNAFNPIARFTRASRRWFSRSPACCRRCSSEASARVVFVRFRVAQKGRYGNGTPQKQGGVFGFPVGFIFETTQKEGGTPKKTHAGGSFR